MIAFWRRRFESLESRVSVAVALFGVATCGCLGVAGFASTGAPLSALSLVAGVLCVSAVGLLALWGIRRAQAEARGRDDMQKLELKLFRAEESALDILLSRKRVEEELTDARRCSEALQAKVSKLLEELRLARAGADLRVVEDLRDSRRDIEAARGDFLEFLEKCFFPVGERYAAFVARCEEWDERVSRILQSLDGSLATLGMEGGAPILRLALPEDPADTFGSKGARGQSKKVWRDLVKLFHGDTRPSFELPWLMDTFDAIFLYVNAQWEALQGQGRARS